jgi:hypothetical protein
MMHTQLQRRQEVSLILCRDGDADARGSGGAKVVLPAIFAALVFFQDDAFQILLVPTAMEQALATVHALTFQAPRRLYR